MKIVKPGNLILMDNYDNNTNAIDLVPTLFIYNKMSQFSSNTKQKYLSYIQESILYIEKKTFKNGSSTTIKVGIFTERIVFLSQNRWFSQNSQIPFTLWMDD